MLKIFDIIHKRGEGIALKPTQTLPEAPKQVLRPKDSVALFTHPAFGIQELASEHCYLLCMDSKCHPLGICFIAKGAINEFVTNPRDMLCGAVLLNAASCILVHNHPSTDPQPSDEDLNLTKTAANAFRICGMQLLDHIIIGDEKNYASIFETHPQLFD